MNTSDMAYERDALLFALIEPETVNAYASYTESDLTDCDEEIVECQDMVRYFVSVGDQEEVKNWKRYLQMAKTRKRKIRERLNLSVQEDKAS